MKKILYILLFCSVGLSAQDIIKVNGSSVFKIRGQVIAGINPPSNPSATISVVQNGNEVGPVDIVFRVTLSAPAGVGGITVNYIIPLGGTATPDSDYLAPSGSVTVAQGQTTADFTVTVLNDGLVEAVESVIAQLDTGPGYDVSSPMTDTAIISSEDSAGGTILASVSATDAIATESGTTPAQFTFSLSEVNTTGSDININYHMDGPATEGSDYGSTTGSIAIANGSQSAILTINPLDDGKIEPDETVMAIIDLGTGYSTEGFERAIVEIIDNDDIDTTYPTTSGTSTIANSADFENAANAGTLATVTGSFSVTGLTPANGMVLKAGGGILSGTLDVSTIGIENSNTQLFSNTIVFSSVYDKSRISIEMFGADSGDANDDNAAIATAINQCQHLTNRLNGSYVKNNTSSISRAGTIDWDFNGSTIRTTSAVNFRTGATDFSVDELFRFSNIQPFIYNGTIDMTDTYGRVFRMLTYSVFSFKDLIIENLYNPQPIRSYAIRLDAAGSLTYGEYVRNTFRNITAAGDGTANNADGISKGIWGSLSDLSTADFELVHYGNTYHDITGDDAEGVYYISNGDRDHTGHLLFDNENFSRITRRLMKMCEGQFTIQNSTFVEFPDAMFPGNGLYASALDVFSTTANPLQNINIINNTIKSTDGESPNYWLNSYTEIDGGLVKGNIYSTDSPNLYSLVRLGSGTSTYAGVLKNLVFKENTFNNGNFEMLQNYTGSLTNPTVVDNNTFNFTASNAYTSGPIKFYVGNGDTRGYLNFTNNTINWNTALGSWRALISGESATVHATNIIVDGNTITFNGTIATYEYGSTAGNLTNSTFTNNTVITGSGSPILLISGDQTGTTASGNSPSVTIQ